ncbi:acetate--CoA ligase [Labilibaculum sp. A4]|uniref:acetate--CoA ligase n=1 Tax=Labilibaculum euxinus TaxID=2686357 RepID=UPI000F6176FC|nr:acetate--CoA ligase [Labilibaculum euxinus]MDQ1772666.1 acetate--CoA ligase [Labilibaculum euxinus]MWN76756.1 acetate--CoA ligase [Labilibaculum euxinus]
MIDKISTLGGYIHEYQKSVTKPEEFWSRIAESFFWKKKWDKILDWNFSEPKINWFTNGKMNITENIFERHLFTRGNQPAIIWEPNEQNDENRILTYNELFTEVKKFSNVLLQHGIKKGDRIAFYMPMIPELAIAMLACARIGAIHSIVFAGFSANSLADRIIDAEAKMVITSDGGYRGSKIIPIKEIVDEAVSTCPTVEKVIVVQRTNSEIAFDDRIDLWWHECMAGAEEYHEAETMDAEDTLFILYTSGSTDKPKGIVHTCGGYMVYTAYTFKNVFQYSDGDIYFCSADIGWITGHSYIVYGPLLNGATTMMFEGIPTYPDAGRYWDIVSKYNVSQFYTAPTAIRSLMSKGQEYVENKDLSSLKVLGTVGEPINEEAWHWYHDHIGKNRCPIVDTWWQTETGGIAISPIAGIIPTKPSFATLPLPGIQPIIVDAEGKELSEKSVEGNLCIKYPWPGMLRTIWGDHERFKKTYFSTYENLYFTGDGVKRDEDGYYRILGRVDDVINVSGHRMGTAEVENAINEHPLVNESAVVGFPHDIKGQGIYAFVVCGELSTGGVEGIKTSIRKGVTKIIGPIAKPDRIQLVRSLPKTRSGKIMRRILRKIAEGDYSNFGDISTLLDTSVVDEIIKGALENVNK